MSGYGEFFTYGGASRFTLRYRLGLTGKIRVNNPRKGYPVGFQRYGDRGGGPVRRIVGGMRERSANAERGGENKRKVPCAVLGYKGGRQGRPQLRAFANAPEKTRSFNISALTELAQLIAANEFARSV